MCRLDYQVSTWSTDLNESLFPAAVAFLVAAGLLRRQGVSFYQCPNLCRAFGGKRIVHPFANLAGVYKSGFAEYVHMVRKGRLPDSERFQQLAAAFFAAYQKLKNFQTVIVCQSLE